MAEPLAHRRSRRIPDTVDFDRIATIYRLTPSQLYAGGAYSVLVGYVMWGAMSSTIVVGWLAFRLLLCAVRIRESHVFARDPSRMQRIGHWRTRYLLLMLLDAPSWSVIAIFFVPHVAGNAGLFLYASVLIIPAIGLFSLVSHFPTAVAFVVEIITPLLVKQLLTAGGDTGFVVSGLCVYAGVLVYEAWRSDARWVELARLRFESDSVAREGEHARQLAEESSRAKSAFLANMSHEIRTPLNGMMGLTELLLRSDLSVEQRNYLQLSLSSSKHLLKLVEQVLDMSKINAEGVTLDEALYNPHTLADEVLQTFAAQAARSGVVLRCRVAPSVPLALVGDAMRLRQVLTNLVGNAVKFTEHGHVTLSMTPALNTPSTDGFVELSVAVSDTGPGIPVDKQAMVFQAFTQADASTTRVFGGTGLGLTISAALVSRMGGKLELESSVGVGSQFYFALKQSLPRPGTVDVQPAARDLQRLTVLWVDANDESREWYTTVLEGWNARVIGAAGVVEAQERLARDERYRVLCIHCPVTIGAADAPRDAAYGAMVTAFAEGGSHVVEIGTGVSAWSGQPNETVRSVERVLAPPSLPALWAMLQRAADDIVSQPKTEPASAAAQCRFTTPSSIAVRSASPVSSARAIRVLLAEDNDVNALIATKMLQQLGADVTRAVTGAHALDLIAEHPFDMVFMDVQIPVMDGYDATRDLRAREWQRAAQAGGESDKRDVLPVIALTANVLPADRARCEAVGMTDYLAKPIVASDLAVMYSRYANGRARVAAPSQRMAS